MPEKHEGGERKKRRRKRRGGGGGERLEIEGREEESRKRNCWGERGKER